MATYQNIKGLRVKYLGADPSVLRDGEVWYNSVTGALKGVVSINAWSSAMAMPTPMSSSGGCGIQTAALSCAGSGPNLGSRSYNGTGWIIEADMSHSRDSIAAAGTLAAAIAFGGNPLSTTSELYDGSSWTNGPAFTDNTYANTGTGPQTATLKVSGFPSPLQGQCEEYNGVSWTEGGAIPTNTTVSGTAGTLTAAVIGGGLLNNAGGGVNTSYEYNGTGWTLGNTINTTRSHLQGYGIQTAAVIAGGGLGYTPGVFQTAVEDYNGTTWATNPASITTARSGCAAYAGTTTAGMIAGGYNPGNVNVTEEYNQSTSVVTAGAWAAGDSLNTSRTGLSGAGSVTAGVVFGGTPPTTGKTEEYNGTSWTENPSPSGDMGTARYDLGGFGTQVSAVAVGGGPATSAVEEYGGTTWTAGGAMPSAFGVMASTGTETAGLIAGGNSPAPMTDSWEYNGTGWAASPGPLNTGRQYFDAAGTQTSAVAAGGWLSPGDSNASEEYNGTVWASGNNIATARRAGRMAGVDSDSAILYGGQEPGSASSSTEGYDGTNWSTRPALATARRDGGRGKSGSTATSAFLAGGSTGSPTTATEEFTGAFSTVTASTLTTS